jgi:transcriptional regulator with XRE-family HTH domain
VSYKIRIGNKIRLVRRERGLTLADLARKTGVSVSQISEMERGLKSPTVGVLIKLAEGLNIRTVDLIAEADAVHTAFTRKGEGKSGEAEAGLFSYVELSRGITDRDMDIFLWRFEPGYSGQPQARPGEEIGHVLSGEIEFYAGEDRTILEAGDTYQIKAKLPHYHKNSGTETAEVMIIRTPPLFK